MASLNPDFRGADEVIVPMNMRDLGGWAPNDREIEAVMRERRGQNKLMEDMPVHTRFGSADTIEPMPEMLAKWNEFQKSKGRYDGSCDWSLLDEFTFGKPLLWLPQIIGSCVVSNTFRGWVVRLNYQISILGMAEEFLGKNEFGPNCLSFYGPWSYGAARKRANMRGSDGLYCEAMQSSLLKDGVMSCSTPALLQILGKLKADGERDLPEPQSESVYRSFGDWKYIDELRQYADYTLEECPSISSVDDLKKALTDCKPTFHCSMIAVKKAVTHKDGFAIHKRDPNDKWAHNMEYQGYFIASDGELFFRFSNESWGPQHIYNVPYSEVDDWYRRRDVTSAAIGMIRAPKSAPVAIA